MRVFYATPNGEVIQSARVSLRDVSNLIGSFLPKKIVLEDTKQVAIREGIFGNNFTEVFYTLAGYDVYRV